MSAIGGVAFGGIQATRALYGMGAKVGNIRLPDFKNVNLYTKTEPLRSDEEIKEDIVRIAKADAEKGKLQSQTREFLELEKEYVSSVSPDREGIITNSTKQIFANADAIKSKGKAFPNSLLELLIERDKKDKITAINMNCSNYKACFEGDTLTYAGFYDSNGEVIADYTPNGGWACPMTKAEGVRENEFFAAYNEVWNSVYAEINAQNKSVPKHLEGGTTIDAYA
jgi:hypothetical protein